MVWYGIIYNNKKAKFASTTIIKNKSKTLLLTAFPAILIELPL